MSRLLEFGAYGLGIVAALAANWSIYSGAEILFGRLVIGAFGLGIAVLISILVTDERVQQVTNAGLLLLGVLMAFPAAWILFDTNTLSTFQVILGLLGFALTVFSFLRINRSM